MLYLSVYCSSIWQNSSIRSLMRYIWKSFIVYKHIYLTKERKVSTLRSRRFSRNLLMLIILVFCSGAVLAQISGFDKIAENDYLILHINKQTTEIAVEEKSSGEIWYSNPPDRNEMEARARGTARDLLNSQVKIIYYDLGDRMYEMNTYGDADSQ